MASGLSRARFRCTECGNCCRGLRVPVTRADLARLGRAQSSIEWLAPDEVDMSGEPSSFVELDVGRRLMVLAQQGGACVWLDGDRCSVHAARPSACRLYPLEASFGRRGGVRRLRIVERGIDCRYELDAQPELGALRHEHALHLTELAGHQALVRVWNRGQKHRQRLRRRLLGTAEFLEWLATTPR